MKLFRKKNDCKGFYEIRMFCTMYFIYSFASLSIYIILYSTLGIDFFQSLISIIIGYSLLFYIISNIIILTSVFFLKKSNRKFIVLPNKLIFIAIIFQIISIIFCDIECGNNNTRYDFIEFLLGTNNHTICRDPFLGHFNELAIIFPLFTYFTITTIALLLIITGAKETYAFSALQKDFEIHPPRTKYSGERWSNETMVNLVIATLLLPYIGIISGVFGLNNEAKRRQGGSLIAIATIELAIVFAIKEIQRVTKLFYQ